MSQNYTRSGPRFRALLTEGDAEWLELARAKECKDERLRKILPQWQCVVPRPSMVSGRNRHATHPVNAMLNYTYAVLESLVRIATVAHGFDPTIGYLHVYRPGRVASVYDLMEPLRPRVDRSVLEFVRSHGFSLVDFVLGTDGVCRLHP
jgi:CRISPR-associated protein Cas1